MNLAVVGATGMVGGYFLKVLEERNFPAKNIYFFASARSAGKELEFKGKSHIIRELSRAELDKVQIDIALFSAGGAISAEFAPYLADKGTVVIDNSSKFRMDGDVPLIVPEVNPEAVGPKGNTTKDTAAKNTATKNTAAKIIANPNCTVIQAMVALSPLHKAFGLKRVIYSTYQAVSGAGMEAWKDLDEGLKGNPPKKLPHPIANNLIPQIDTFQTNGYTGEEIKMINETKKILNLPNLPVTATCVRVPVFNVHSLCINVEFENKFGIEEVVRILETSPGIILKNDISEGLYPMPICADGKDEVFVGRIRRDESVENGLNMWVVADNLRKGAATNAVQIAELLIYDGKQL
jgi:aspartate-semialdehyde dehydrogenase